MWMNISLQSPKLQKRGVGVGWSQNEGVGDTEMLEICLHSLAQTLTSLVIHRLTLWSAVRFCVRKDVRHKALIHDWCVLGGGRVL